MSNAYAHEGDPFPKASIGILLAQNDQLVSGLDKLDPSFTGDIGAEFFFVFFGASKGSGATIDGDGVCPSTTICGKYGVGLFVGVGLDGSASLKGKDQKSGKSIFFRFGKGTSAIGGSIGIDELTTGKVFFGPGAGAVIGIQQCEIVCDE